MITLNQMSPLGIGTSRSGSLGSRISPSYFGDMLTMASTSNVNVIDTANAYGSGDAERLIGKCIRDDRAAYFIITKAGIPYMHTPGWLSPLNQIGKKVKQKAGFKRNYAADYLLNCLPGSNKRLGVDMTDAFLLHEPEWQYIDRDSTWAGLEKIRQMGLAKYTGVSTSDYRVVEEGVKSGQVQVVQTSASWNNETTDPIIDLCKRHHIPVIANQVLKPYKSLMNQYAEKTAQIHALDGLQGMSLAQFLIAAVLIQKHVNTALIGTTDLAHLEHNITALDYTENLKKHLPVINQLLS